MRINPANATAKSPLKVHYKNQDANHKSTDTDKSSDINLCPEMSAARVESVYTSFGPDATSSGLCYGKS